MKIFLLVLLMSLNVFGDEVLKSHINDKEVGGLAKVLEHRYLKVLTTKNAFDYYIYQGVPKGIQFEMAKRYTQFLNKKFPPKKGEPLIAFELIPVDYDQLIPMLVDGKGDIIAAGLTATEQRRKLISFSKPYQIADEVILTNIDQKNSDWREGEFAVRKSSSYYEALKSLDDDIEIEIVDESLHTENIMELVSLGKFDFTLVDSYLAKNALKAFPGLKILDEKAFGKNIQIAWATRKEDIKLLGTLDEFMPSVKKGSLIGNILNKKYFSDMGKIKSEEFNIETSRISKYDQLIKKYSKQYGFDWRLISALCYQESRFQQGIENRWGAIGLFQVKQMTANEPYINIKNISGEKNAENNIHAGIKYLAWIKNRYFDSNKEMRERDRIRMTMAAYNAGPARVLKAINRAKGMGLDPNKWFRNVELGMLKLKKKEPVLYVSEINKRFVSYTLLGIE